MFKSPVKYIVLVIAVMTMALPASAQFRFGVKAGIAVNSLHFDRNITSSDNRAGFTGGITTEFSLPVVGLGLDASLMYTHRNNELTDDYETYKRDYIELPIHLHYKFNLPVVAHVVKPYAFAGPNFAFLAHESRQDRWDNRSVVTSLDLGFGLELLSHVQISATYCANLNHAFKEVGINKTVQSVSGRDRTWTITAAYLF